MNTDKINWLELLVSALVSAIISLVVTKLTDFILKLSFATQILVALLLFIAFLSISVSVILMKTLKKIVIEKNKLSIKIKNMEETISNYGNSGLKPFESKANTYFALSLVQNYYEPLRIEYLKEAANEKHVIASLILGNLYETGLTYNNREILPQNIDEAQKLYKQIKNNDYFGVSEWLLGWFCENRLTTDSTKKTVDENLR